MMWFEWDDDNKLTSGCPHVWFFFPFSPGVQLKSQAPKKPTRRNPGQHPVPPRHLEIMVCNPNDRTRANMMRVDCAGVNVH